MLTYMDNVIRIICEIMPASIDEREKGFLESHDIKLVERVGDMSARESGGMNDERKVGNKGPDSKFP